MSATVSAGAGCRDAGVMSVMVSENASRYATIRNDFSFSGALRKEGVGDALVPQPTPPYVDDDEGSGDTYPLPAWVACLVVRLGCVDRALQTLALHGISALDT